jgi:hypothetical protein
MPASEGSMSLGARQAQEGTSGRLNFFGMCILSQRCGGRLLALLLGLAMGEMERGAVYDPCSFSKLVRDVFLTLAFPADTGVS